MHHTVNFVDVQTCLARSSEQLSNDMKAHIVNIQEWRSKKLRLEIHIPHQALDKTDSGVLSPVT